METAQQITDIVREHRRQLEAMSFAELSSLPEFETVEQQPSGLQITVARKANSDGSVSIIVEGWRPMLLGMGARRTGDGFRITATGEHFELGERDYW